ncbi:succinate dehydrogenase (ubiquinone) cytochrome b560 subunit [Cladophialophora yegresii CBS 114405]|uniref:Succinate dehydrogenase (Ubiquinone) cytochrome b560 subunit n=1 Tax=Cladophialophora yegresii CBS 114405 TaxID=1182544 RepID=W9WBJ9_9EURO|nr:succinate dehydrogenase (ubiquinone) cytochrome b560 subunit [Cladophialophora yegresii CBS 114405]EXJ61941.1 succinate dehydrogenase (ubiquinone) cytochrome b560 subunit [Cladophialophora yegresii CBS 114405]
MARKAQPPQSLPRTFPSRFPFSTNSTPSRNTHFKPITTAEHASHLASQRFNRPVSPHLSIYRPQITWYSGALMRNSAILITAPIYIFGAAYLIAPLVGWHLDSTSVVEWFACLPHATKLAIKAVFAFPFCFHIVHGLRHLVWDTGMMLTNRQVAVSGWLGLGVSVLATVGLVAY